MGTLKQDLNYALRMMRRNPWFSAIAILSLALGIGANTAIFSLMNALMLRSLPVQRPAELVLFGKGEWAGITDSLPNRSWQLFSYPFFRQVRNDNRVFSGVAAIQSMENDVHGTVEGAASPEKIKAQLVSGGYFSILGVKPVLGRILTDADDQTPGGSPVAVISDAWWERRFARDPSVVGKTFTVQSTVYTIVGVTGRGFFGTSVGISPDLWIPLSMEATVPPGWDGLKQNLFQSLYLIARLNPGVTREEARANVNLIFNQALHAYVGSSPSPKQTEAMNHASIELTSAAAGLSELRHQFSKPLIVLMSVVGLVLLIACANIANLMLARATARQKEIAVRMALGAGRARLLRQLLTESLLLAVMGGALGLFLATWANQLLLAMISGGAQPLPLDVSPDAKVLVFTSVLCLFTALLFGAAPALRATKFEINASFAERRSLGHGRSSGKLARALIVSQVALSLVLLIGSGLFLRSLINLTHVDTGFDKENVLLFGVDEASAGYKEDIRLVNLQQQIEERITKLPGVKAASFSMFTFNEGEWSNPIIIPGAPPGVNDEREILGDRVGQKFFAAMGIPLVLGRTFGPQDTASSQRVVVINETLAKRYFGNSSPLGRRFMLGDAEHPSRDYDVDVVGVVQDAKYESLWEQPHAMAYFPSVQHPSYLGSFEVRVDGNPQAVAEEIRDAVGGLDKNLPISALSTLAARVDRSLADEKLVARLSAFFGLLAVFLACIGIYGVMSHMVARRTNEIGVRMALGAGRGTVLWMIMKEVVVLALIGFAIGVPVALAGDRFISSLLYGLSPGDPGTIFAASLILAAVAAAAGYLPARRASLVEPMEALRYE